MSKRKPKASRRLNPVEKVDLAVADAVALDTERAPGRWVERIAELGDQPPMLGLGGGVVGAGLLLRDEKLARAGLRVIAANALAIMVKTLVKDNVDRTRPTEALEKQRYALRGGTSKDSKLRSMPSGHTAGTLAAARALADDYPGLALPIGAGAAAVVVAQLPSRHHFLSDVLVGAAIGFAAVAVARRLIPPYAEVTPATR